MFNEFKKKILKKTIRKVMLWNPGPMAGLTSCLNLSMPKYVSVFVYKCEIIFVYVVMCVCVH